jgi:molecular chaperone GrpE
MATTNAPHTLLGMRAAALQQRIAAGRAAAATEKELLKALASVGIEAFGAVGDKFDPHRHEAMLQVPADASRPAGTVTTLLKGGFKLQDRVLRAAQVAVAVAPPA